MRRLLRVSDQALGNWIIRVQEQCEHPGLWNHLGKQFNPLRRQLAAKKAYPRDVTAWPRETGDQTVPNRTADGDEDDRDRRGRAFCRLYPRAAERHDHIDLTADEVDG